MLLCDSHLRIGTHFRGSPWKFGMKIMEYVLGGNDELPMSHWLIFPNFQAMRGVVVFSHYD